MGVLTNMAVPCQASHIYVCELSWLLWLLRSTCLKLPAVPLPLSLSLRFSGDFKTPKKTIKKDELQQWPKNYFQNNTKSVCFICFVGVVLVFVRLLREKLSCHFFTFSQNHPSSREFHPFLVWGVNSSVFFPPLAPWLLCNLLSPNECLGLVETEVGILKELCGWGIFLQQIFATCCLLKWLVGKTTKKDGMAFYKPSFWEGCVDHVLADIMQAYSFGWCGHFDIIWFWLFGSQHTENVCKLAAWDSWETRDQYR